MRPRSTGRVDGFRSTPSPRPVSGCGPTSSSAARSLARTSPIHAVIRGAADGEPFAVELRVRLLRYRRAHITASLQRYVGADLRSGLTAKQAGERACALMSPEMFTLLTVELLDQWWCWTAEWWRTVAPRPQYLQVSAVLPAGIEPATHGLGNALDYCL